MPTPQFTEEEITARARQLANEQGPGWEAITAEERFSAFLEAEGEERLVRAVRALAACSSASEFMAAEDQGPRA